MKIENCKLVCKQFAIFVFQFAICNSFQVSIYNSLLTSGIRPLIAMLDYAEPVSRLIDELKRLPGIGHKSAQRLAFHLLRADREDTDRLVAAVNEVKDKIVFCST